MNAMTQEHVMKMLNVRTPKDLLPVSVNLATLETVRSAPVSNHLFLCYFYFLEWVGGGGFFYVYRSSI